MAKDVILTGLRSNDEFHIGNYLGAILLMVELQRKHAGEYQLNMFIPDLHSFTTPIDHASLYDQTHQNLKVFVAAGLDIDQPDTFIYRQSYIPAHSELTWILDCFTGFGEMSRMTEFKDKAAKLRGSQMIEEVWKEEDVAGSSDRISVGLFNYPVLMAADILIYGAKYVPVGEDQRQHVEFARDLAIRLNNKFGDLLVVPADNKEQLKFAGRQTPVRIRSLRNPAKKMSKSIDDPAGTIMLSDKPEAAAKKILAATTDNQERVGNPDFESRPGVANLVQILRLLGGEANVADMNYKDLKELVAKNVSQFLANLQTKLTAVDEKKLIQKLEADEAAMRQVAGATLAKVQKAVGLRPAA
ncbi:MAG: tryptophanyl-tRNA ligase [Candidatus Saccharibacteria bacterium GW2011_GWA2_46_10]|nr:MAG: tryptophanyl-tRNA ligase [Candidatus Saccharibacteria bacterium GW2011_GWA2_46_10]OGL35595.1 MAG: tryptophan--tRNA ligase [Candidatus Saccharibacteria bacterium RIFCSPHIGHO2_12_FULL_47_17]